MAFNPALKSTVIDSFNPSDLVGKFIPVLVEYEPEDGEYEDDDEASDSEGEDDSDKREDIEADTQPVVSEVMAASVASFSEETLQVLLVIQDNCDNVNGYIESLEEWGESLPVKTPLGQIDYLHDKDLGPIKGDLLPSYIEVIDDERVLKEVSEDPVMRNALIFVKEWNKYCTVYHMVDSQPLVSYVNIIQLWTSCLDPAKATQLLPMKK